MPPLSLFLQQLNQTRRKLAQLEDETIHLAASLIQGCVLINRARRRLRVERSLNIIRSSTPQTLRRWIDVDSAPLFKNPAITSILYIDYRKLVGRQDIRQLYFYPQSIEICIHALANRIAADQYQSATVAQRRFRGWRGRARFHQLSDERKRNIRLRNECATKIQQRVRGFQQRQRYRAKVLKIFERRQLQQYQEERRIDRTRREQSELRARMMKLYVHERQLDESRRLFGTAYAQKGVDTEDHQLSVTLNSCSKAYLSCKSDPVPYQRNRSGAGGLSKDERSRLIWAYNKERWGRRTGQVTS